MLSFSINAVAAQPSAPIIDEQAPHAELPGGVASLGPSPFEVVLKALRIADPIAPQSAIDAMQAPGQDSAYETKPNDVAAGRSWFDAVLDVLNRPRPEPIRPKEERNLMVEGPSWFDAVLDVLNRPRPDPIRPKEERDLMITKP